MRVENRAMRLCVYLQTTDRYQGRSLYQAVVAKAKALGIARVAVTKGCAGYGGSGKWHAEDKWRLIQKVPVMVETLDQESRIQELLFWLDDMRIDGLVTMEKMSAADTRKKALTKVAVGKSFFAIINNLLGCFKRRIYILYIPGSC